MDVGDRIGDAMALDGSSSGAGRHPLEMPLPVMALAGISPVALGRNSPPGGVRAHAVEVGVEVEHDGAVQEPVEHGGRHAGGSCKLGSGIAVVRSPGRSPNRGCACRRTRLSTAGSQVVLGRGERFGTCSPRYR